MQTSDVHAKREVHVYVCMCVFACMCVCVYVHACTYVCVLMYVCLGAHVHVHVHAYVCVRSCSHIHRFTFWAYMNMCLHIRRICTIVYSVRVCYIYAHLPLPRHVRTVC